MTALPQGWEDLKIKNVTRIGDGAHASIERLDEGVLYLSSKNFGLERLKLGQVDYISQEDYEKHFRAESKAITKPLENDVLLGIIGSLGAPYLVKKKDLFGLSSSVAIIRPDQSLVDPKYLYYWFKSPTFQLAINQIKSGVAQSFLSLGMIGNLPCYFPKDLEQQRKIAALLASYEDLIENNLKRIKLLEEMAQITYDEWFARMKFPGHETAIFDEETGLPEAWKVEKIGNVYKTSSGGTPSTKNPEYYESGTIKWVRTQELKGKLILDTSEYITELGLKKSSAKMFPANTVLLAMYGNTIGETGFLATEASTNQACCAFLTTKNHSYYIYQYLRLYKPKILNYRMGAAQENISQSIIQNIEILIPSEDLIERYGAFSSIIYSNIENLMKQNILLKEARDILLPRLLTGMINIEQVELPEAMLQRIEQQEN